MTDSTGATPTSPDTAATPATSRFCGNCGAPRDAISTRFCRNCGTPFDTVAPVAAPEASSAFAPKGGFWRRTGAYLLDSLLLAVAGFILGLIVDPIGKALRVSQQDITTIGQLLTQIMGVVYFLWFWSGHGQGQTFAMRALGLRVVRTDGTYMSLGRAFLRNIGFGISVLALGIGVIWVAFDKNKQGWHDKIADTYVIRL